MSKVFIVGHEGTTGLRIQDRLMERADIELLTIEDEKRKDLTEIAKVANEADIVFLCLPDAAAKEVIAAAGNSTAKFIDASTAHRTNPDWAYGFPELSPKYRAHIASSKFVANPGCHASGIISIVYPLVKAGILPADYPISFLSLTGYSGGGKKMIAEYEDEQRDIAFDSPRQYGLGQAHKHLKEVTHVCGLANNPLFSPIVADYYAGMEVTLPLHTHLLKAGTTLEKVWNALADHYKESNIVKVMPFDPEAQNGLFLNANAKAGLDDLVIYVTGNNDRMVIHSVFDNLGKGASGAAVQCMNIMLGLPEETGLAL